MSMNPQNGDGQPNILSMIKGLPPQDQANVAQVMSTPGGPDLMAKHMQSLMTTGQPAPAPGAPQAPTPNQPMGANMPGFAGGSGNGNGYPGFGNMNLNRHQTKSDNVDKGSTTDILRDAGKFNEAYDVASDRPEYKAAQDADQRSQDYLNMMKGQGGQGSWVRPLSALADAQTGSHLAETAENPAQNNAMMLKYQDDLDRRKQEMYKTLADAATKFKSGAATEGYMRGLQNLQMSQQGMAGMQMRMAMIPMRAGQDFDKQLAGTTGSVEALNRGDSFLNDKSKPLNYQAFLQAQQDVSKGLAGAGNVTDAKTMMDMQQLFQGTLQTLKTKYGNHLQDDVRDYAPEVVAQVNRGLQKIRGDFNDSINRQADQISKSYESSFNTIPNLAQTVQAKRAAIAGRFPVSEHYNQTGHFEQPAAGGADVTVYDKNGGDPHVIKAGPGQAADLAEAAKEGYGVKR
jgi:hypothetical protein